MLQREAGLPRGLLGRQVSPALARLRCTADTGAYARVGEATEVALRVLAEKVGLAGYGDMPRALAQLGRRERATFCNDAWQSQYARVRPRGCRYLAP